MENTLLAMARLRSLRSAIPRRPVRPGPGSRFLRAQTLNVLPRLGGDIFFVQFFGELLQLGLQRGLLFARVELNHPELFLPNLDADGRFFNSVISSNFI